MEHQDEKPRSRDLQRTRQHIMAAARKEFATYGLQGARVDRIARESGANKQMIYYIFGGKEELFLAALESLWEKKSELMDGRVTESSLSFADLPEMLTRIMDAFANDREATQMLMYDIVSGAQFLRKLKQKRPELFGTFEAAATMIENLAEAGVIRKIDPEKSIILLSMLIICYPTMKPHFDIITKKGGPRHKSLTDIRSWQEFIAKLMARTILLDPPPDDLK